MKLKLAFCVVAAAAVAVLLPRSPIAPAQANDTQSADIAARIRPLGLNVVGQPAKQGSVYVVNALDPRGAELRVIVDARQGHVVSIGPAPAQVPAYAYSSGYSPHYDSSPRIINIAPVAEDDDDDAYAMPAKRPVERRSEPRRPRIESRRSEPQRIEPQRIEPRAAVRQVTPPLERPRDPLPQTGNSDKVEVDGLRDEIRREFERRQRVTAPPPPRERPRTVLAPPPYADQALTPIRPLHRRDTGKFTPPADPAAIEEPAPPTAAEEARSEAHAAVPQILPQIPPPPRAVELPAPSPEVALKPEAAAPAVAENPEDTPPGTAVGDFGSKAKR